MNGAEYINQFSNPYYSRHWFQRPPTTLVTHDHHTETDRKVCDAKRFTLLVTIRGTEKKGLRFSGFAAAGVGRTALPVVAASSVEKMGYIDADC